MQILVAEDSLLIQKLVVQMLKNMGYEPDVVPNGVEVLNVLKRKNYDLILMDVQMPEMGGLEAARIIAQTQSPGSRPKIIAMTADVRPAEMIDCMEAGMSDYLIKPISAEALKKAIEKCKTREKAP